MVPSLDLSSSECIAIEELKKRIDSEIDSELKDDNSLFLRFLRARDFQIDIAEDMLRRHLSWRKQNQIENIFTEYTPNKITLDYLPLVNIGFDKNGSPIRYLDFGRADFKGLLKSARQSDVLKTVVSYYESDTKQMAEQSFKLGKSVHQWIYILNFDDYSFVKATHKPTIEFLLHLFQVYEANYPERLKVAFIINSSVYFTMIYSIVKPLFSPATIRKINIFGKDGWKKELLNYIDPEVLPSFLGGNKTDPDGNPLCTTICMFGKPVPEHLYMSRSNNRISNQPGAQKLVVSRKSKTHLPLEVEYPGSMIEWEFETETRDINFSLCYKEENGNTKELVPKQRIDAHLLSEVGMYKCEKNGTYILVFDNSYSWFHRKEIFCKASVIPPNAKDKSC